MPKPVPKTCPCCGGALELVRQRMEMPGRRRPDGRRLFMKYTKRVFVCRRCEIGVRVQTMPRNLA